MVIRRILVLKLVNLTSGRLLTKSLSKTVFVNLNNSSPESLI